MSSFSANRPSRPRSTAASGCLTVARTKSSNSAIAFSKRICARSRGSVGMDANDKCSLSNPAGALAARGRPSRLLEGDLGEAAELAAVQLVDACLTQQLDGADADAQVLVDPLAIEVVGHAGQL